MDAWMEPPKKRRRGAEREVASCLMQRDEIVHSKQNEGSIWFSITLPKWSASVWSWLASCSRKFYRGSDPCRPPGERQATREPWMRPSVYQSCNPYLSDIRQQMSLPVGSILPSNPWPRRHMERNDMKKQVMLNGNIGVQEHKQTQIHTQTHTVMRAWMVRQKLLWKCLHREPTDSLIKPFMEQLR